MSDTNEEMASRIEALAKRIRSGEFDVKDISVSQPPVDDPEGWAQGIAARKPGPDVYWTIHLIYKIMY